MGLGLFSFKIGSKLFLLAFNVTTNRGVGRGGAKGAAAPPPPPKKKKREEKRGERKREKKEEKRERKLNQSFQEHAVMGL